MYALSVSLLRLVAAEGSEPRFMKEEEEESSEEEEEELTPEEQGRHPLRFQWNTAISFSLKRSWACSLFWRVRPAVHLFMYSFHLNTKCPTQL